MTRIECRCEPECPQECPGDVCRCEACRFRQASFDVEDGLRADGDFGTARAWLHFVGSVRRVFA